MTPSLWTIELTTSSLTLLMLRVWRRWKYLRTDVRQALKNLRKKDFDPLLAKVQLGSTDQNRELWCLQKWIFFVRILMFFVKNWYIILLLLENTGCFVWNFVISNGCNSKTVHIWPYVGKAKMCLRGGSFYQCQLNFSSNWNI